MNEEELNNMVELIKKYDPENAWLDFDDDMLMLMYSSVKDFKKVLNEFGVKHVVVEKHNRLIEYTAVVGYKNINVKIVLEKVNEVEEKQKSIMEVDKIDN